MSHASMMVVHRYAAVTYMDNCYIMTATDYMIMLVLLFLC